MGTGFYEAMGAMLSQIEVGCNAPLIEGTPFIS